MDGTTVHTVGGGTLGARVIIGADGPLSTVGRSVGLVPERTLFRMITATVDTPMEDEIDLFFGRDAPGGIRLGVPPGP